MTQDVRLRVAVLASGTGTNLQALIDRVHGTEGIQIVAVASDKPDAQALIRAERAGIETSAFPLDGHGGDRAARDGAIAEWLLTRDVELVVLAGYMQIMGSSFLSKFPGRVINLHPALLPAFPGLDAIGQALDYGVKVFGVTVHFVDEGVDTGPIILQRAVELPDAVSREDVEPHIHAIEHSMLPEAVRLFARGAVRASQANPRRVLVGPGAVLSEG